MQQPVEDHPRVALFQGGAVGVFELPEDLRFAQNHGIQAGSHTEQVAHGFGPLVVVYVGGEFLNLSAAHRRPLAQKMVFGAFPSGDGGDFHPVAGGEDEAFTYDRIDRYDAFGQNLRVGQGESFAHFNRGRFVVQPHQMDFFLHGADWSV